MTTPEYACVSFVTADEVLEEGCSIDEDLTDLIEDFCADASDVLYQLSGGRVTGVCERLVRPVGGMCGRPGWWGFDGWAFGDWGWGTPATDYAINDPYYSRLGGLATIPLRGPRTEIVNIWIDGTALGVNEYGLINDSEVFRKSGSWPFGQDLTKDPFSEKGTFAIDFKFGLPPNRITKRAAIELILQWIAWEAGDQQALPPGTVSANIQGVGLSVLNRADAAAEAAGGGLLPKVAQFLGTYAPQGRAPTGVWSPEIDRWNLVQVSGPDGS